MGASQTSGPTNTTPRSKRAVWARVSADAFETHETAASALCLWEGRPAGKGSSSFKVNPDVPPPIRIRIYI